MPGGQVCLRCKPLFNENLTLNHILYLCASNAYESTALRYPVGDGAQSSRGRVRSGTTMRPCSFHAVRTMASKCRGGALQKPERGGGRN
ncbi:hypothetical protein BRADI_1g12270v3 [Brachypodium distachyon]|uniref:Uncharacterized protein n=1 Tax=Brachypodium distachyon TaxID=15368 RepID=A0A0Q3RLG7_BRADI|nr:hypothetical protein BRADI_1g12270v3 [Brachypodium distachyon]